MSPEKKRDKKKTTVETDIPDYLRDFVTRGTVAMENISRYMEQQSIAWPQLIDTLNSDFLVHNTKTDALCEAIDASVKEAEVFRKDVWNKMWSMTKWVVVTAVGVLAAIAGWRIVTGGVP